MKKNFYLFLIFLLFFHGAPQLSFGQSQHNFEISKNLDIYNAILKELNLNYVDDIKPGELTETAINAMLEKLDPYTVFIPESQVEDVRMMTTGEYGGIGALIQKAEEYAHITEPYEGFPAHKAGLIAGDLILEINGLDVKDKTVSEISELLKGTPGSKLRLKIKREEIDKPIEKELTREKVRIDNIPYQTILEGDIGYLRLSGFTQKASAEVKEVIQQMKDEKALKGLIIDLRGNGGGLLNEAVDIANLFVERGELIVSTRGKAPERSTIHRTRQTPFDLDIPLVVLVNEASASASEIVAGALQDLDRAVVVGQKTFGKGLVQNVVPLTYNSQMKITVAKYYIPSGRCIQAIDYSHKDENGGKKADSLVSTFKTRGGRLVYDNGGITPDILIDPIEFSPVSANLYTGNHIFRYANKFARENAEIAPAEEFEITDEIFADFLNFIKTEGFSYTTESERIITDLCKIAEEEHYLEAVSAHLESLKSELETIKEKDFMLHRNEIVQLLRVEIVSRYYYQKGKIISAMKGDIELESALDILHNPKKYSEVFQQAKK